MTYYGSVSGNTLTFTPVYNSFAFNSTNNDYEPSTANWQPPTNLDNGMKVNGAWHSRQHDHHRGE